MATEKTVSHVARNQYFDVIRGLAIFGVVAIHSDQGALLVSRQTFSIFTPFAFLGAFGVELFFFISGALMVMLYGFGGTTTLKSKNYWVKRIARIVPLWIAFFIIFTVFREFVAPNDDVQIFLNQNAGLTGWALLVASVLTFTAWMSPLLWNAAVPGGWSIQAEMAHYLAFATIRRWSLRVVLIALIAINAITLALMFCVPLLPSWATSALAAWGRLGFFSTVFYFLAGATAYLVFTRWHAGEKLSAIFMSLKPADRVLLPLYIATVLVMPLPFGLNAGAIAVVIVSLLVALVIMKVKWITHTFTTIGKYSYFIYFMHFIVVTLLEKLLLQLNKNEFPWLNNSSLLFPIYFVSVFVVTLPIAWLSYRYFEAPFLKLARGKK